MLSGILYRPLANAMNFRFVALEVHEHLLWKRWRCLSGVSLMYRGPHNDDTLPPPSISTEQNRPIVGSIAGIV